MSGSFSGFSEPVGSILGSVAFYVLDTGVSPSQFRMDMGGPVCTNFLKTHGFTPCLRGIFRGGHWDMPPLFGGEGALLPPVGAPEKGQRKIFTESVSKKSQLPKKSTKIALGTAGALSTVRPLGLVPPPLAIF